tara:strand:+ start:31 stop:435 length:405 start_codon:yes stop_codon:yes gene_type:complete
MSNKQILVNKIRCPDGTILESRHRHDYREHVQEDGEEYFIDGGLDYVRYGGTCIDKIEVLTSYYGDDHTDIRENFTWGRNFNKEMNRLPKTEFVLLKDITDSHLEALIDYTKDFSVKEINMLFKDELVFRGDSS